VEHFFNPKIFSRIWKTQREKNMNDIDLHKIEQDLHDVDPIKALGEERRRLRSIRRAIAFNAVNMARQHAGTNEEPISQNDADVIMAIMELLDRVAGQ
jgi:hypothetical protein